MGESVTCVSRSSELHANRTELSWLHPTPKRNDNKPNERLSDGTPELLNERFLSFQLFQEQVAASNEHG